MAGHGRFALPPLARRACPGLFLCHAGGREPPHTHVLGPLVKLLAALSRMTVTSRYPLDDTPPSELFDARDSDQALTTAMAVLAWVEELDQSPG